MQSINRHLPQSCADELPVQERLNYFTGQFLTERDLKDEQGYQIGKHRQHNRYLHGYGAVCGLRVKEHPNPACRDRFVVLEPGLALDCHGREVVVPEAIYVDLQAALAAQKADPTMVVGDSKNLLISLCYSECKTEFVPALYADCGCNDTGCEASRIYEGFEVEAKLVTDAQLPKSKLSDPTGVRLDWTSTLTTNKAVKVAIDPEHTRIYVVNAATPNQIMVYDTDHYCLLKSISLAAADGQIIDLAVSANGKFLYVLRYVETTPAVGATPGKGNYFLRVIQVKDTTTGIDLNPVVTIEIQTTDPIKDIPLSPGSSATPPHFAVGSKDTSGKVVTLDVNATAPAKKIIVWTDRITTAGADPALAVGVVNTARYYEGDGAADSRSITINPDGSWFFVSGATSIQAFKVASLVTASPVITTITIPNGDKPALMAVSGDSLWLYVVTESKKIYVFQVQETPALFPVLNTTGVDLGTDTPIDLQVSPNGKWGYVLFKGVDDKGLVRVIDRDKLVSNPTEAVSVSIGVTANPRDLALAADGRKLYGAGEGKDQACGGVSILNINEDQCQDLFWQSLDHCPECIETCIPLAVVKGYIGGEVTDDKINNRIRPLVPSTQTLQKLILCALNSKGESAPATPPTTTDSGVKSADAESVPATDPAAANFDPITGNIHFKIPRGQQGSPGQNGTNGEGLEPELTQIVALNWIHRKQGGLIAGKPAIVIGFSRSVNVRDIKDDEHIFQVLIRRDEVNDFGTRCWCPIIGKIVAADPVGGENWDSKIITEADLSDNLMAKGIAFIPSNSEILFKFPNLLICLRGDFVVDENKKAIDAEFVRGQLPTGDRPQGSKVGIQGGLFESWFTLKQPG
jgi:hypothetical protein